MIFKEFYMSNSNITTKLLFTVAFFLNLALLFGQEKQSSDKKYSPTFDASLKTKYEYALNTGMSRFSVRNSRVGLSGSISDPISYRFQIELNAEGKLAVLDLFANIKLFENFNLVLGQTSVPLFNSYTVAPQTLMFINRPFIGKFITGSRDIGALANYTIKALPLPIMLEFGVFNGFTINDPVWTNTLSYAARVQIGTMQGFRATAKIYDYPLSEQKDFFIWGADLRYAGPRYRIEAEVMNRHNRFNSTDRLSYYIQGGYSFPLNTPGIFHDITPVIRWDAIGDNNRQSSFNSSRFTVGLDFGLTKKPFGSVIRLDYEHYFGENPIAEFISDAQMGSNKFSVELLLLF